MLPEIGHQVNNHLTCSVDDDGVTIVQKKPACAATEVSNGDRSYRAGRPNASWQIACRRVI